MSFTSKVETFIFWAFQALGVDIPKKKFKAQELLICLMHKIGDKVEPTHTILIGLSLMFLSMLVFI